MRESVNRTLEEISEGSAFSHSSNEWGKDYFVNAKALARGIYNILKAMEDEGNSNDYRSTTYLYYELERRVIEFNQTYKLILLSMLHHFSNLIVTTVWYRMTAPTLTNIYKYQNY